MTHTVSRKWAIFGVVLPLAALIGFCLASPDLTTLALLGVIALVLCIPILLRWHHPMLVLSWNFSATLFFLPGNPPVWFLVALTSLGLTLLNRILDKKQQLLNVPSLTISLLSLVAVVLLTMHLTGGIGLRSFGSSSYGGKKYLFIIFAVIGYFALSSTPIPQAKAGSSVGGYLLSGMSPLMSQIAYSLGPGAWFLFLLFPPDYVMNQAIEDFGGGFSEARFGRLGGFTFAGLAAYSYMIARYGVRGILDMRKPWRLVILIALTGLSLMGGFRSILVVCVLIFGIQFYFERLYRTQLLGACLLALVLGFGGLFFFASKLPLSIQRSLSILPLVDVAPVARRDAEATTEWRLQMWSVLWGEIPKYLILGKGNTASATDYYMAMESTKRGLASEFEMSLVAGDYHNGPLSILVPFGLGGMLAFTAFLISALRVLYANYQNGSPGLKTINTFLLSAFIAKALFFFLIFGALHSDLPALLGLVGLSISLNGGMKTRPKAEELAAVEETLPLPKGLRSPA